MAITPVIPKDVKTTNTLVTTTLPIIDWIPVTKEPATIPVVPNPVIIGMAPTVSAPIPTYVTIFGILSLKLVAIK